MRIRIAIIASLLGIGTAHAQPAPDPTPPPPNAPLGQGEAEIPNFQMTPMEEAQPEPPPQPTGPGPGPRETVAGASDESPSADTMQTMAEGVTAGEQTRPVGLAATAEEAIREDYPALVTDLTITETPEGMLEVDGVVPVLGDKLGVHDTLTELPESDIVVNRILVAPPRRTDRAIEREVRRLLRSDELLGAYSISVDTRNQRVFLMGRVPTPLVAQTALRIASDVKGVRDVNVDRLRTNLP